MEIVTATLTGIALIKKSVDFIKENINTVQDISGIAKQIDGFFEGEAQMNKKSGTVGIKEQFGIESTANDFIDRKLLEEKRQELKNIITERFSNNIPCFVIKSITGDLLGAVWCKNYTYAIPNIKGMSPIKRNETFEINNIFISEAARGSGLSSLLLTYAMTSMKNDEDKNIVFSRIYQERKSSIIAHKRVGFIKYGILELGYKFGKKINAVIEDTKK